MFKGYLYVKRMYCWWFIRVRSFNTSFKTVEVIESEFHMIFNHFYWLLCLNMNLTSLITRDAFLCSESDIWNLLNLSWHQICCVWSIYEPNHIIPFFRIISHQSFIFSINIKLTLTSPWLFYLKFYSSILTPSLTIVFNHLLSQNSLCRLQLNLTWDTFINSLNHQIFSILLKSCYV